MSASFVEPARKAIEVDKIREWRVRLHSIVEPTVRYLSDPDAMKTAVIKQNAETAKALIEEIDQEMGPHL